MWQFLSGFCLTHPMLCAIEEKCFCAFHNCSSERQSSEGLRFLVRDTKWEHKPRQGASQQSTRSRSAWTMAKVSTDVQAVIESLLNLDSLRDAIWSSPSNSIPQAVSIHNSLSTTAFTSYNFKITSGYIIQIWNYVSSAFELGDKTITINR